MNTTNTQDLIKLALAALTSAQSELAVYRIDHPERNKETHGLMVLLSNAIAALQSPAPQPPGDDRVDALRTLSYINGVNDGWNLGVVEDNAGLEAVNRRLSEVLKVLKDARSKITAAQASEPSADIHANSETLPGECWKNPLFPLETRLQMADGAVAFERKVNANLRARLEAAPARAAEPLTDEQFAAAMERELPGWNPDVNPAIYAHAVRHAVERAHGITTTPAAKETQPLTKAQIAEQAETISDEEIMRHWNRRDEVLKGRNVVIWFARAVIGAHLLATTPAAQAEKGGSND